MKATWRRLGLVFRPDPGKEWMRSHAALPTPLHLEGSIYRIYFASRDDGNRSHVGFFDVDLNRPTATIRVAEKPVLAPGPVGYFDDQGIYAASAVRHNGRIFLYTIGWNPGSRPPLFYSSIGLAVSDDEGSSFVKYGKAPIMGRSEHDPCLVTSPVVIMERGRWRMWYVSGVGWDDIDGALYSRYHIKYAESDDGICWRRSGVVCIDFANPNERNIARTCVVRDGDVFHAWFSTNRGSGYRIEYARSVDGIVWDRGGTPTGLELSVGGWDSKAMAYPYVVKHSGRWFMFYNGNEFGREGIGVAICDGVS